MVNMQMFHVIKNWTKFECDPPPDDDILFELLFTSSNRSLIVPNTVSDDYKKISEVNLVGLVFFVENFPDLVKEHLFQRYQANGGNEIVGILLYDYHKELHDATKRLILRALERIFDCFPDQTIT